MGYRLTGGKLSWSLLQRLECFLGRIIRISLASPISLFMFLWAFFVRRFVLWWREVPLSGGCWALLLFMYHFILSSKNLFGNYWAEVHSIPCFYVLLRRFSQIIVFSFCFLGR